MGQHSSIDIHSIVSKVSAMAFDDVAKHRIEHSFRELKGKAAQIRMS